MLPVLLMLPVANVANAQLGVGNCNWQHFHIGNILKSLLCFLMLALVARAEPGYTNHAGNVVSGWPVKLTATHVVLSDGGSPGRLGGTPRPTTNSQLPTYHLPSLHLPRIRAAADRGGLRPAARAGCREAGDRRGGEGDGAFAQARGEGALHAGGERRLLREVRRRAQKLSGQAGQRRRHHASRAKDAEMTVKWHALTRLRMSKISCREVEPSY